MLCGWVGGCDGVVGWGGITLVSPTCRTRPPHAPPIFFKCSSPIFQLPKLPREIGTEQLEMSWLFSWKLTNLCGRVKVEAKLLHFKHSARVSHCTVSLRLWNLTSTLCHNKWESEAMQCCKKWHKLLLSWLKRIKIDSHWWESDVILKEYNTNSSWPRRLIWQIKCCSAEEAFLKLPPLCAIRGFHL